MRSWTKHELARLSKKYGFEAIIANVPGTPLEKVAIPVDSLEERARIIKIIGRHNDWWWGFEENDQQGFVIMMEAAEHDAIGFDVARATADFKRWYREKTGREYF